MAIDNYYIAVFWSHVAKTADGCWLWTGAISRGYGKFRVSWRQWLAHRFSWTIHYGDIPERKQVLHRCDVRSCVRPDHLFLGDWSDNLDDMVKKGRAPNQKLDKEAIDKILTWRREGKTERWIGKQLGVSKTTIRKYLRRHTNAAL